MLMPPKYRRLEDYFELVFVANMPIYCMCFVTTTYSLVTEEQLTWQVINNNPEEKHWLPWYVLSSEISGAPI